MTTNSITISVAIVLAGFVSPVFAQQFVRPPVNNQAIQQQDGNNQRFQINPQVIQGLRPNQQQETKKETQSIEAESIRANATGGSVATQNMRQFGSWSGDNQIIWTGNRPSQLLRLPFNAPVTADYDVVLHMTKANDFGDVSIGMDGRQLATFSGFSTRVEPATVNLGRVRLNQGSNELIINVTGKFSRSTGYRVGVDRIVITRDVPIQSPPVYRPPAGPLGNPQGNKPGGNIPNDFPNRLPPSTNNPSGNFPNNPNQPWADVPLDAKPGPSDIVTILPAGMELFQQENGSWVKTMGRLDSWKPHAFQWRTLALANSTAVIWQVSTKVPPPYLSTTSSEPLEALLIPGFVAAGMSDSPNSQNKIGTFVFDFGKYKHMIKDPMTESFYVRAIPINNAVDRKFAGQPSNIIEIKPPISFDDETFHTNDNYQGNAIFVSTDGEAGNFEVINREELSKDWSIIVPGNFGGMNYNDFFAYDRFHGKASIFRTDGKGKIRLIREMDDWLKTWDIIVPGKFNHDEITDLFVYSRRTKSAKVLMFNSDGSFSTAKVQENLNLWDEIVAGQFGGSRLTDLLFYSRARGHAKFYAMQEAGDWTLLQEHGNWSKTWDKIVPCNFDDGGSMDLLLYRQVTGDTRIVTTDQGQVTVAKDLKTEPHWDLIVPGMFNSDNKTDFFLYDRVNQRGQYAMGQQNNLWLKPMREGMRSYYSHIIAGNFDNNPGTDLMMFDNHHEIRIHAIRCMDFDGSRAAEINPQQIQEWVDFTNDVYTQAGIKFIFDPESDFEELRHTTINSLDPSTSTRVFGLTSDQFADYLYGKYGLREEFFDEDYQVPTGWTTNQAELLLKAKNENGEAFKDELQKLRDTVEQHITIRNSLANEYAGTKKGKLVIYFRWGSKEKAANGGYSSDKLEMVVMPGGNSKSTYYFQDATNPKHNSKGFAWKLMAHEIGHCLSLNHTFGGYQGGLDTIGSENSYLKDFVERSGNELGKLDGDSSSVLDTPPDIHPQYFVNRGMNPAKLSNEVVLNQKEHSIDARFSPDRHNVMNYFHFCDGYVRISTDQVNRIRSRLHTKQNGRLIGKGPIAEMIDAKVIPKD